MQISNECDLQYKTSQNKRLLIELALIRMAQLTLKKK
jgi:DNA polymerase III subunit gamma/tau